MTPYPPGRTAQVKVIGQATMWQGMGYSLPEAA
jgi:hypothetical protein